MWKEFYVERSGPRAPVGWYFAAWALEELVSSYDESRTKNAWQDFQHRLKHNISLINEVRPSRRLLNQNVWLMDIPREKAESELTSQDWETRERLANDFADAMWLVGTQAEVGQLFTSCRAKSGGPLIDLDKGIWGVDDFWPRLSLCAISIDAPYDIVAEPTHWLFIEAQSMYWMIDNLRIDLGLRPKYQRRVAPQDALRPDVFPGIAESKEMTEYWFRLRAGITEPPLIRIDNFKPAAVNSGAPGRPTSMGLVLELFEKRIAEGVLAQDKLAEATVLSLALDEINKQRVGKGLEPHPSLKPRSIRPKIAARYDEVQRGV